MAGAPPSNHIHDETWRNALTIAALAGIVLLLAIHNAWPEGECLSAMLLLPFGLFLHAGARLQHAERTTLRLGAGAWIAPLLGSALAVRSFFDLGHSDPYRRYFLDLPWTK